MKNWKCATCGLHLEEGFACVCGSDMAEPITKGGKRPGAGRPPGPPTITVRIRLSPAQHAAYVERGSEHWIKRVLSEPLPK